MNIIYPQEFIRPRWGRKSPLLYIFLQTFDL
jgi:hypothetical protein